MDEQSAMRKMELAVAATEIGGIVFSDGRTSEEFDRGCDHIHRLLTDSYSLYSSTSFSTSVFLSITAIEEIAKLEIAVFRNNKRTAPAKNRRDDALFSHKAKHAIALQEVITIGHRLPDAIGAERLRELIDIAESGGLVNLREAALYMENVDGTFLCPNERILRRTAREILLLALEVWDDKLVGFTNHTYDLDVTLMQIFKDVAAQ